MATMKRNYNLEEINTDAFMGISYLNYQTFSQKIIFICGLVLGIAINVLGSFVFDLDMVICVAIGLIPALIGVFFGCNYNEDLTLFKFVILIISNPVKRFVSLPAEDLSVIRFNAERIKKEEEEEKRKAEKMSDEGQKKFLKTLLIIGGILVGVIVLSVVLISSLKTEEVHHTVYLIDRVCKGMII